MKLIKNHVIIDLKKDALLINTLNGSIDRITTEVEAYIRKCEQADEVEVRSQEEKRIYDILERRGYLTLNEEDERAKKEALIGKLRQRYNKSKKIVKAISLVMTYECNFRCPYCFEATAADKRGHYITEEHIDAALSFAGEELQHIGLFGGEPLLPRNRKAIEYLINKAPDKHYSAITNGYYLDQFIDLFTRVKVSYIMVTLDGKRELHDRRRVLANGGPTFDVIIKNIGICLRNGIPIRIRMNVDKDTISQSEELRCELIERFAEYEDNLSFEISPMMELGQEQKNELITELSANDYKYDSEGIKNVLLSRCSPIVNCIVNGERLYPTYSYCAEETNVYIMDPFGFVYPCLVAVGHPSYAIGKFYPVKEIYKNNIKNRNIETIEKCKECKYSLLCGGGCPIKTRVEYGTYQPECDTVLNDLYKRIPKLLELKN